METMSLKRNSKAGLSDSKKEETILYFKKYFGALKPKDNKTDRQIREESSKHFIKKYGLDSE